MDFDEKGGCEFVESFYPPCVPMLEGLRLVGTRGQLEGALRERGYVLVRGEGVNSGGTDIPAVGVGIWTDREDDEPIETVYAWRRGYWEAARESKGQ